MGSIVTSHSKYKGIIVSRTDMRKLRSGLKTDMAIITARIVDRLTKAGEKAVKTARERGSYFDITGNLRSSIGYVVLVDGKPVKQSDAKAFKGKKAGSTGEQGVTIGQAMLSKLQARYPAGIALVVCAGMNYAAIVEAVHHKDVLTSAEMEASRLADRLLKNLTTEE